MGKKLLVADDSLTIQKVIRLALSNEGYEIQAVSDGNEAAQQIPLFRPDVVLIDVSLPGKSAFDVRKDFGPDTEFSQVQFILMSSAFEQVDEKKVEDLHFQGRLIKPFDPAHLRKVLNEVSKNVKKSQPPRSQPEIGSTGELTVEPPLKPPSSSRTPVPPPPPVQARSSLQDEPTLSGDLWESGNTVSSSQTPPPPPAHLQNPQSEEDIKGLTEETIKMSGLDQFEWTVEEKAKKTPNEPQITKSHDPENDPREVGENTFTNLQVHEPALEPPLGAADTVGVTLDLSPSAEIAIGLDPAEIYRNAPEKIEATPINIPRPKEINLDPQQNVEITMNTDVEMSQPPKGAEVIGDLDHSSSMKTSEIRTEDSNVVPLSTEQMEAMISRQLEKSLAKMAEKMFPDLAEKIIREEIHKMLSNPPVSPTD